MSDDEKIFPYKANSGAAIFFVVAFAVTGLVHIYQAYKTRALFMLVLIIATALQVLGYITRKLAIDNDPQLWSYVVSQTCIVVSPAFLAAQDYMIIGRMMSFVGPDSTFISHTVITKLFVFIDIACVITQASGVTMISGDNVSRSAIRAGRAVLIGGLLAQVAAFLFFTIVAVMFDLKSQRLKIDHHELRKLRPLFTAFYISAALIIGRSVYRTIEFATINFDSTTQGYLYNTEWPFYVLDAVPVLIATVLFNIVYPASYLPRKKGLRIDGSMELQRKHWWSREVKVAPSEEAMVRQT